MDYQRQCAVAPVNFEIRISKFETNSNTEFSKFLKIILQSPFEFRISCFEFMVPAAAPLEPNAPAKKKTKAFNTRGFYISSTTNS